MPNVLTTTLAEGMQFQVPTNNSGPMPVAVQPGSSAPVVNRVFDSSWGSTFALNTGSPNLIIPIPWQVVEDQNLDLTLSLMAAFQNDGASPELCTLQYGPSKAGSFLTGHDVLFGNTLGATSTLQLPMCRRWIIPFQDLGDQLDIEILFEAPSVTLDTPINVGYIEIAWAAVAPGVNTPFP